MNRDIGAGRQDDGDRRQVSEERPRGAVGVRPVPVEIPGGDGVDVPDLVTHFVGDEFSVTVLAEALLMFLEVMFGAVVRGTKRIRRGGNPKGVGSDRSAQFVLDGDDIACCDDARFHGRTQIGLVVQATRHPSD